MPKDFDLVKITMYLYAGDRERVQSYYPHVPYGVLIRELLRKHLAALDAKASKIADTVKAPQDDTLMEDMK